MNRDWTAGGVFVLRHAGMPFDLLATLAAPDALLSAADALLDEEQTLAAAAEVTGIAAERTRAAVNAADPALLPARDDDAWRAAAARWGDAVRTYRKAFDEADSEAAEALRGVMARPDVQEAVFLSNPEVYRNMLVPFLDGPRPDNARWRRVRRQLYTYLQRFCAKNETVSFFGPMAYGTTRPGHGVTLRTDVPRRRRVFFAQWAGREVADAVARDPRLRTVLPFRRTGAPPPAGAAAGAAAGTPAGADELLAAVASFGTEGATLPRVAEAVHAGLRDTATRLRPLVAGGRLVFGIAAAPYELDPLGTMLDRLARLPDGEAVREWTGRIGRLRALLTEVEATPFPGRTAAVERLEHAFSQVTGTPARRGAGAVYADRAVFYEECASPFALEVGEETLRSWAERIGPALELSAAHGAAVQRAAAAKVRDALGAGPALDLLEYSERLRDVFDPGGSRFVPDHVPVHPTDRQRQVTGELLAAAALLPGDRYALVDLCPAVSDVRQLPDAHLVLGRCHHHLLTDGWLGTMFPGGDGFGADARRWVADRPGLVGFDVGRRNKGYYLFPGRRVVLRSPSAADADDPHTVWPQRITVENTAVGPRCRDETGREVSVYLPLSDYVKYPPYAAISPPQVLHAVFGGPADTSEVTVGGVVYQRPRWTLDAAAVSARTPYARFLKLRRLARTRVPGRFVFCRTDRERKPYLIDLESVLAADLAAHVAKGSTLVTAEQMRPGPEELWLRDENGHRYTCELRMQLTGRERTR